MKMRLKMGIKEFGNNRDKFYNSDYPVNSTYFDETNIKVGKQGWRSGECACLPPMCPGFDSRTWRNMWVKFVISSGSSSSSSSVNRHLAFVSPAS